MDSFAEFSEQISVISRVHSRSRFARLLCRLEYYWRKHWTSRPLPFKWVDDEGVPVGDVIDIYHLTLHDMMPHQAAGVLTGKVLLEGLRANAIQVIDFRHLDDMNGVTTIQPMWVASMVEPAKQDIRAAQRPAKV